MPHEPHHDDAAAEAALVERALERARAELPPEGVTIEAGPIEQMREELFAVLLYDAEHPERAA